MTESGGKGKKEDKERVGELLLISPLHSPLYNELQLWLQIKTELFSLLGDYLQSGAWWRYDHNRPEGKRTPPGREEEREEGGKRRRRKRRGEKQGRREVKGG